MEIKEIKGKLIEESYFQMVHPTGLRIFVYPKPSSSNSYALFGTQYGSLDSCFHRSDSDTAERTPEGIAHYLEHKLFEGEDGDAFSRYAETGAGANAYTSFENTCYLFSCTDHFYDSLEILLDFVQSPYFTKETVAKEQGIIGQEIRMYQDDPQWRIFFNLIRSLYQDHPIRQDIAGTVESIRDITPELLYRCYDSFYNLHNMVLSVSGNVTVENVLAVCDKLLKPAKPVTVERVYGPEPDHVLAAYTEDKMEVVLPLFQIGYKEAVDYKEGGRNFVSMHDVAVTEVLLDILSSESSPLFRSLLQDDLINESSFHAEYFEGDGFAAVLFGGESKDPKAVQRRIQEEAERLKKEGISEELFQRSKKSLYGDMISGMDSVSVLSQSMLSNAFKGRELFTGIETFSEVSMEEVEEKLHHIFREEVSALSVILPL